jgi:hypothetical protein
MGASVTLEEKLVETTVYSLAAAAPGPSDRRADERHLTLYRVGSLAIGDRRELCLIKNISAGGMLIRAYCEIPPGTRISVELKHGTPVHGIVRWAEDKTVGITFDTPVDVVDLLAASMDGPRPRMPRVEVTCPASLREDGTVHRIQLRDISQGGIKFDTRGAVTVGSEVVVTLPGLAPQPGVVRWQDSGCYGITFNRVLPLPVLVAWLQEQRMKLRAAG